ncbi:MAG: membrane dipeptidase [Candidatus Paceibacteria bacterium]|jgi:membrane dipeptidase
MQTPFVFDAHVDTLQLALDMGVDLAGSSPGQLDLKRARAGGLGGVVMTAWVDPRSCEEGRGGAGARAERLFDTLHELVGRVPEQVGLVRTVADWNELRSSGRLAIIAGIEGGHPLEDSIERLEAFFERGLRVLNLVWNNHLSWARTCQPGAAPNIPEGLNSFGRCIVRRMDELGIVIDLSHSGPRTLFDALEATSNPTIASHSGCSALQDHVRNLTDDQLRAIAAGGGVIGVPFLPSFLDASAAEESAKLRATDGYRSLRAASSAELEVKRTNYMKEMMTPLAIERLVDHIEHIAEVAGIEHVGLGSDFDGITTTVEGLEDAASYCRLVDPLRTRGFSAEDVARVLGKNMERVVTSVIPTR